MLVAVKTDNGYLIARDTRINTDDVLNDSSLQDNDQIFPSYDDNETIISVEGDFRIGSFIRYLGGLLPNKDETLTMKHMVTHFVPELYKNLCNMHYADKNDKPHFNCSMIVARKSKAYLVMRDGGVLECGTEEATGEGSNFADGVLYYNYKHDPLLRIMETFKLVSKHCFLVSNNIIVGDTSNPDGWVIYDEDDVNKLTNSPSQA